VDATDVMIWILVALAAAVFAGVRMWRDFTRKRAEALQTVARDIRKLRHLATVAPRMAPVQEAGEPVPEGIEPIMRDLEAARFRRLGDVVESLEDGTKVGVLRWFTAHDGVVFGWTGLVQGVTPVMLLLSEDSGAGFVATMRTFGAPLVAGPPAVREQQLTWEEGLGPALHAHREALTTFAAPVAVGDLPSALASLARLYAMKKTWRSDQDPEALLEADVRKIAGARFDEFGPLLIVMIKALDDVDAAMAEMERRGAQR
jgi:hypothetical protein